MAVLSTVLHSTMEKSRKQLIVAAFKSNALLAYALSSKMINMEDGGSEITNPLVTGRNPNVTSYQYYDKLPVAQTNEFNTVRYNWSRVAGTVIISGQEQDENQGSTAVFKLLKAKMQVLELSIKEKFSTYLYGIGNNGEPYGLAALIPDDPTQGELGGISRVTNPYWRTSAYDFAGGLNSTNIEEALDDVLLDLTNDGDKPDLLLCGRNMYRLYRAACRDKFTLDLSTINSAKGIVDLGFAGVAHNGSAMVYDEDCPVNKMYAINTKHLTTHILSNVNMVVKSLTAPWDTDATGSRVVWQGQFCLWQAFRKHAVIMNEAP